VCPPSGSDRAPQRCFPPYEGCNGVNFCPGATEESQEFCKAFDCTPSGRVRPLWYTFQCTPRVRNKDNTGTYCPRGIPSVPPWCATEESQEYCKDFDCTPSGRVPPFGIPHVHTQCAQPRTALVAHLHLNRYAPSVAQITHPRYTTTPVYQRCTYLTAWGSALFLWWVH